MLFLALMVHTSFLNFVKMSDAYELHRMLFIYKHFVCKSEFFRSTARHASTSAEILQNNTVPAKTCHYCLTFSGREPFFCASQTHVWQNVNQPTESGHMSSIWKVRNSSKQAPNQSWDGDVVVSGNIGVEHCSHGATLPRVMQLRHQHSETV